MMRPLTIDDVPQIPELLGREQTGRDLRFTRSVIETLFPRLFIQTPHAEPDIHGWVTESDGKLTGMIGTVLRRMQFGNRPLRAAINAELYVDPAYRGQMLGVKLFQQAMNGPQDLTISDIANEKSLAIWQSLGGTVARWYSMNWLKILQPGSWPLSMLRQRTWGRPLAFVGKLAAGFSDRVLSRLAGQTCQLPPAPKVECEPLTVSQFIEWWPRFSADDDLRPDYDQPTAEWVWERLDCLYGNCGPSEQILVRSSRGEPIGWYIMQSAPGEVARVAQIAALPHTVERVFDHLLHRAAARGAVAVSGRVQPRYLPQYSDRHCLILRRGTHTLVHARDPQVLQAFVAGRASLSMLDAEGPLQIWKEPARALIRVLGTSTPWLNEPSPPRCSAEVRHPTPWSAVIPPPLRKVLS